MFGSVLLLKRDGSKGILINFITRGLDLIQDNRTVWAGEFKIFIKDKDGSTKEIEAKKSWGFHSEQNNFKLRGKDD
ncbi:hypothetical protein [Desulfocapsa sulfexigens]|nr:hypothetical protein [Desulfocapsa sulfexigens]